MVRHFIALFALCLTVTTAQAISAPVELPDTSKIMAPLIVPERATICEEGQVMYDTLAGPACAPANTDAGQACTHALECEGSCLADANGSGMCSAGPFGLGCTDFLDLSGAVETICVE